MQDFVHQQYCWGPASASGLGFRVPVPSLRVSVEGARLWVRVAGCRVLRLRPCLHDDGTE